MTNNQRTFLRSTGQEVLPLDWVAQTSRPWPNGMTRVVMPYTEQEMAQRRDKKRCHVQIVRNENLQRRGKR